MLSAKNCNAFRTRVVLASCTRVVLAAKRQLARRLTGTRASLSADHATRRFHSRAFMAARRLCDSESCFIKLDETTRRSTESDIPMPFRRLCLSTRSQSDGYACQLLCNLAYVACVITTLYLTAFSKSSPMASKAENQLLMGLSSSCRRQSLLMLILACMVLLLSSASAQNSASTGSARIRNPSPPSADLPPAGNTNSSSSPGAASTTGVTPTNAGPNSANNGTTLPADSARKPQDNSTRPSSAVGATSGAQEIGEYDRAQNAIVVHGACLQVLKVLPFHATTNCCWQSTTHIL